MIRAKAKAEAKAAARAEGAGAVPKPMDEEMETQREIIKKYKLLACRLFTTSDLYFFMYYLKRVNSKHFAKRAQPYALCNYCVSRLRCAWLY